jgi:hypothetical protein
MISVFSATLPVTPRTGVKSISLVLSPAQAVLDFSDYEFTNDAKIYESKTDSLVTKHGGTLAASHPIVNHDGPNTDGPLSLRFQSQRKRDF